MEVSHQQLFRVDKPVTRTEPKLLVETRTERVDASYKSVEKTDKSQASHLDKQRKQSAALSSQVQTPVNPSNSEPLVSPSEVKRGAAASKSDSTSNEQTEAQLRADQAVIQHLKLRDQEVRAHEQAHASVGGAHASAASFSYTRGPNGALYATGGEVGISTSPIEGDPQATLQKARQVQAAALAPLNPSAQDRSVAARAGQMAANAIADLANERSASAKEAASGFIDEKGEGDTSDRGQTDIGSQSSIKPSNRDERQAGVIGGNAVNEDARNLYNQVSANRAGAAQAGFTSRG